ncbi:MAG: hypothetical protein QY323_06135 [Patescibacteria group bacterium]|nr:MAG: hypothetical protein QY323_06135 [Patescibacteria group bacterium]
MQRKKIALFLSLAALALVALLWFLLIAPRYGLPPFGKPAPTAPTTPTPEVVEKERHAALNLYLAPPTTIADNAARAELTLLKATVSADDGKTAVFFTGAQRVMLQPGAVQKVLSERIPDGRWTRMTLEFSPAAELAYANGDVKAALLEKKQTLFTFDAQVGISRSLAVFGVVPLEAKVMATEKALLANLSADTQPAQTFVFGGFLLEPRGRGDVFNIENPTLASVIKEDLGFDITIVLPGSSGFQPATGSAPAQTPPQR